MDFSTKLTETRKAKGLTQEEVAEKCNLNVRTIQRVESGQVQPRPQTVRLITEALEIDITEPAVKVENRSFIWHLKDLFNLKTHKMRKLTILSSTVLVIFIALFLVSSEIQARANTPAPGSGLTIIFNKDKSIKRVDAVYTHKLTLDSLTTISSKLATHGILVSYRSMAFNESGLLTSIECEIKIKGKETGGSFSVKDLDSTNKNHHYGFYIDNSINANDRFCTGSCW